MARPREIDLTVKKPFERKNKMNNLRKQYILVLPL